MYSIAHKNLEKKTLHVLGSDSAKNGAMHGLLIGPQGIKSDLLRQGQVWRPDWSKKTENLFWSVSSLHFCHIFASGQLTTFANHICWWVLERRLRVLFWN